MSGPYLGKFGVFRDAAGNLQQVVPSSGGTNMAVTGSELDTDGNPVPVYKAHAYTYDGSGNLHTDTVTDGTSTWVRTYAWANGAQTSDSGWVKQ